MEFSNCLLYVLMRMASSGGRMLVQKSLYGWWPHFMHVDGSGCVTEFVPHRPRPRLLLPPPLFRGRVRVWGVMVEKTSRKAGPR